MSVCVCVYMSGGVCLYCVLETHILSVGCLNYFLLLKLDTQVYLIFTQFEISTFFKSLQVFCFSVNTWH